MSKDYQDDWNRSPEIETLDDNNEKGHDSWLLMDKSTSNFFPSGQEEQRGSFTYFDLNDKNDQALPASSTPTYMMDLEYTNSSRLAELQSANTYDTFSMGDPSISAINNSPGRVNKQVCYTFSQENVFIKTIFIFKIGWSRNSATIINWRFRWI